MAIEKKNNIPMDECILKRINKIWKKKYWTNIKNTLKKKNNRERDDKIKIFMSC